jgi:hypothetical protein
MLAVSVGLSADFSAAFSATDLSEAAFSAAAFSEAAFSEAAFSEATFSDIAFSEMPFALTPASGRLARSEEVSDGFESALGVTFFGLAEDSAAAAGASGAGLAVM